MRATKRCPRCGETKPSAEFYTLRNTYKGRSYERLSPYCRSCTKIRAREWQDANPEAYRASRAAYRARNAEAGRAAARAGTLRRHYGMTSEDYEARLAEQGGKCAICQARPTKRRLSVDHDHATGTVRGLLCSQCNSGIGYFRDNPDLLNDAITYLCRG